MSTTPPPAAVDREATLREAAGERLGPGLPVRRSGPLTVCVLGGTGFVGSELVRRLALAGHWVRLPTRSLGNADRLRVLDTVEPRIANIHDRLVLRELFAGADVVVNLVGILNESGRASFQQAHAGLAAAVVAAAREARVTRLMHMSSLGAAADAPSRYLRSKAAAEDSVRSGGVDWTIFRPSVIFGPRDSLTNRFAALLRLPGHVMPLARAGARFAPIHVQDVVEAFMRALGDPATVGGTYELCGAEMVTLAGVVRECARAAELPCRIIELPDALGAAQAALLGLLPGKPFSLDNFRSLARDSLCTDRGCARLGIEPRAFTGAPRAWLAPQALPDQWRELS